MLYSPFMCAAHVGGELSLMTHLREDPEAVKRGLEIVTESLMVFVRECIPLGVDGFYHSTPDDRTGETRRHSTHGRGTDNKTQGFVTSPAPRRQYL